MKRILLLLLLIITFDAYSQEMETNCGDGIDNDGDGLIDCFDKDCSGLSSCPTSFPCPLFSELYQVRDGVFARFDPEDSDSPLNEIISDLGMGLNAIGYNVEDGYIYGMRYDAGFRNQLIRLDFDGNVTPIGIVNGLPNGLSGNFGFSTGDFDLSGNLYVTQKAQNRVYVIDVNNYSSANATQVIQLSGTINCADFCFNPTDGKFYGLTPNGTLRRFTLPSEGGMGMIENIYSPSADDYIPGNCNGYGAAFADINGNLYFFCNDNGNNQNELIKIENASTENPNTSPPVYSFIRTINGTLGGNDGAACALSSGLPPEGEYCCDGVNLITNGSFENGATGFSSEYNLVAEGSPVNPGNYTVTDFNNASSICAQWEVTDHTYCITETNSKILIVNGQTQQSANEDNVIWQTEEPIEVEAGSQYRFCAYFKHLAQCCFDREPRIRIEVSEGNDSWTTLVNWRPIADPEVDPDPCYWEEIGDVFVPNSSEVSIRILIGEQVNTDGNDLAIDDISLTKLPTPALSMQVVDKVPSNPLDVKASINNMEGADDLLPSEECEYMWIIVRVTDLMPVELDFQQAFFNGWFGGSLMGHNWGLTTDFPGINLPGDELFRVYLSVFDCDCYADASIFEYTGGGVGLEAIYGAQMLSELKTLKRVEDPEAATLLKEFLNDRSKIPPAKQPTLHTPDEWSLPDFQVYPSPTNSYVILDLQNFEGQNWSISIQNVQGREVYAIPQQRGAQSSLKINLDEGPFPNGVYFVVMKTDKGQAAKRFMVSR